MGIKKTVSRIAKVLDSEGKVTNFEQEVHVSYEPDVNNPDDVLLGQGFTPKVVWEEITPEVYAAFEGDAATKMTADMKACHEQIVALRDQIAAEQAAHEATKQANVEVLQQAKADFDALRGQKDQLEGKLAQLRQTLGLG